MSRKFNVGFGHSIQLITKKPSIYFEYMSRNSSFLKQCVRCVFKIITLALKQFF